MGNTGRTVLGHRPSLCPKHTEIARSLQFAIAPSDPRNPAVSETRQTDYGIAIETFDGRLLAICDFELRFVRCAILSLIFVN